MMIHHNSNSLITNNKGHSKIMNKQTETILNNYRKYNRDHINHHMSKLPEIENLVNKIIIIMHNKNQPNKQIRSNKPHIINNKYSKVIIMMILQ